MLESRPFEHCLVGPGDRFDLGELALDEDAQHGAAEGLGQERHAVHRQPS